MNYLQILNFLEEKLKSTLGYGCKAFNVGEFIVITYRGLEIMKYYPDGRIALFIGDLYRGKIAWRINRLLPGKFHIKNVTCLSGTDAEYRRYFLSYGGNPEMLKEIIGSVEIVQRCQPC